MTNILPVCLCIIIAFMVGNMIIYRHYSLQSKLIDVRYKAFICPIPDTDINKVSFNISLREPHLTSYIYLRPFNRCKQPKNVGGDFWWVRIYGPASFALTLLEEKGVYYRNFKVPLKGNYTIKLMLEFTNNDGMKDPPKDFFNKGK